ncbi:hypothetical protein JCM16303_002811 [Sporobolomyces ruberrimus]
MCISKATVAYGLTVRAATLVFAADAWTRLAAPFSFFDLVFLRRRADTLRTSSGGGKDAVTRIPGEVWEEIRYWLVQEEIATSESVLLAPIFDGNTDGLPELSWSTLDDKIVWDRHHERYLRWLDEHLGDWTESSLSPIGVSNSEWESSQSLALVAAPARLLKGDSSATVIEAKCGGDSGPDEHTIVDLSFKLPSDMNQRFTRLIRLFNLEVVESSVNTIFSRTADTRLSDETTDNEEKTKSESRSNGVKNTVTKKIRPRWLLWTMCETIW